MRALVTRVRSFAGHAPGIRVQHQLNCGWSLEPASSLRQGLNRCVAQHHAHDVEDLCETDPSIMKRASTHLVRSVVYGRSRPPSRPACRAISTAGKAAVSSGSKVQLAAVLQSHGGTTPGSRSGQLRPSAIESFISGEHCASVDPSTNCTMECTID